MSSTVAHVETLRWEGGLPGRCALIEQTLLPTEERWLVVESVAAMHEAIRRLAVRGAPAIGVAAGYGVVLGVQHLRGRAGDEVLQAALLAADHLATSRPTAVNLFWALDRMRARARSEHAAAKAGDAIVAALHEESLAIHAEDRAMCAEMGRLGADLVEDGMGILTHCNAGALATGGMGTALAPIYTALAQGKRVKVWADETRPLLQGARLTVYELMKAGVEVVLITDNMAASLMRTGVVDLVFVGSDRIARNGDVCNKIGTYSVALAAREHGVPFWAVAPTSTFDPGCARGEDIHIEERAAEEICEGFGKRTAPAGAKVWNPAFDWTPARLVSGIVCEQGLVRKPDRARVEAVLRRAGRI